LRTRCTTVVFLVFLFAFSITSSLLAADGDDARAPKAADLRIAAELFDEGRTAFKAAAYSEAAEHFEAADARAPSGNALVLAMRSRAEAGQFAKAATLAELIIVRHADNPELVAQAERVIAENSPQLGRIDIFCPEICELVIDLKLVHGKGRPLWRVYVEPGKHTIVANFSKDRDAAIETEAIAGGVYPLTLQATPEPPKAPTEVPRSLPTGNSKVVPSTVAPQSRKLKPLYFWVGVGTTVLLGGVTTWSAFDTKYNPGKEKVREECVGQGTECPLYQEGQRKEVRTNVLIGGTLVLALATAVTGIFATDFNRKSSTPQRGAPNWSLRPVAYVGFDYQTIIGAEGRF
jgi:hypothetical protein